MSWAPKRTLAETNAILCAPGSLHEIETRLVDGRLQRVYKNLWPSLRAFWIASVEQYAEETYIVFEEQRLTYRQTHDQAIKAAGLFRDVYGVSKGDRVGICSRNCPEFLVVFWACQLIGSVPVLANAWLPLEPLRFCFVHTQCKLIVLDSDRADTIEPIVASLSQDVGSVGLLVLNSHEGKGRWTGMDCYRAAVDRYIGGTQGIQSLNQDIEILPEDNAAIMFTSGTTGFPKGVLSTQRQFLTNALNTIVSNRRAALRRGEALTTPSDGPQKGALVGVPLFHVTGLTSYSMMATLLGMKIVLMRKWIPEQAARLIKEENVGVAGGVPAMVADLLNSSLVGHPLEGLFFGGSPAPDTLATRSKKSFPGATLSQGYGLTETNSIAVGIAGEDYTARPASTGLPSPVNDVIIMNGDKCAPPGCVGEVWLRGPNVMKGYWLDPEATNKVVTPDGWLKSGDLGTLDEEGFLYIKDRIKDIIIRGGENIDSVMVENALYADPRVLEAAAVGVPDTRLGELVAAVVSVKSSFQNEVTEASLIGAAQKHLPRFAVPVMIVVQEEPFELTPSRKIMKGKLREIVKRKWEERRRTGTGIQPSANL